MNIMPLFHIHGLIAAVSASIAAGGSVWCTPGFDALSFSDGWMMLHFMVYSRTDNAPGNFGKSSTK